MSQERSFADRVKTMPVGLLTGLVLMHYVFGYGWLFSLGFGVMMSIGVAFGSAKLGH